MKVALVSASDPAWHHALSRLRHDFYHLPAYVELEAERLKGRAAGVLIEQPGFLFFLPLVLTPLAGVTADGQAAWDATSPYGYPSPLFTAGSNDPQGNLRHALQAAIGRLAENNVASLFVRTNPLLPLAPEALREHGRLVTHGQTVWIDLHQTKEQRWSELRPRFRSYINRLNRLGLVASEDPGHRHLDRFIELYQETMDKVGAADWYYFSRQYLETMLERLSDNCSLCVVNSPQGEVVSAGIFTVAGDIAQYHLSGTVTEGEYRDALKLLINFGAEWACARGARQLHLGGGVGGEGDKLFQFKAGFSKRRSEFSSWRAICNASLFETALARSPAGAAAPAGDRLAGFFPPYRTL